MVSSDSTPANPKSLVQRIRARQVRAGHRVTCRAVVGVVAIVFVLTSAVTLAQLVAAVDSVGIPVSDIDRAVDFYTNVLSFEKVTDTEAAGDAFEHAEGLFGARARVVRMKLGDEFIELIQYLTPKGRPIPVDSRSNDRWFQHIAIIVSDMDLAYDVLRNHHVQHASTGPQRIPDWNKAAAGIRAFYFRDPDGHNLEILWFPPGKGNPKWHSPTNKLFLGIDHTAIAVSDTEASLKFYRDILGFTVAGESENYGTEQEHLNNVFGARLHITSIHAAAGPSIEFLEYLTPRNGRPFPLDSQADDLWQWQTRLATRDADGAAQSLFRGKFWFISPGVVASEQKTVTVRDPDGHAMQLVESTGSSIRR
jgi:catechol 2,3-dioxygenase-like lactoylglutathione lyase family enzyme